MKRFLALIMAALLAVVPLASGRAEAASSFVPEEDTVVMLSTADRAFGIVDPSGELRIHYLDYDYENFCFTNPSVSVVLMSGVKTIAGADKDLMVLKQDGSLWAYRFGYDRDTVLGPLKLMDNVARVVSRGYYDYCALTENGELYNIELNYQYSSSQPVSSDYVFTSIDTSVSDVCGSLYLRGNEVRSIGYSGTELEKTLDFSDGKRLWSYNLSYFVATDDGDLWSWGSNTRGQLGNNGQYDGAGSIMYVGSFVDGVMSYPITNSVPTRILSGVESMWFGDGSIRAMDTSGTMWQWGDGENIMTYVTMVSDSHYSTGELIYPDGFPNSLGYAPRQVSPDQWVTTTNYDSVSYRSDGSVWVNCNDSGYIYLTNLNGGSAGGTAVEEVYDSPTGFTDIRPGYYCEEPVIWAVNNGVTTGTTTTTFSPDDTCTQAQILTFLWRAAGSPRPDEDDAAYITGDKEQYYYKAILWAIQNELAEVVTADEECRRSDVVTYLWKLAGSPDAGTAAFDDVSPYDSYATAVAWAVDAGVTTGMTATTFGPESTCTRGQIVTFLYRYFAGTAESTDIVLS